VSREIARNGGRSGYRALPADAQAWRKALQPDGHLVAEAHQARRGHVVDIAPTLYELLK
jgi:hypothetical protein